MKAYYVLESLKGTTTWIVFANSAREARENFFDGEVIDSQILPNGVREVRRAPDEDREFALECAGFMTDEATP